MEVYSFLRAIRESLGASGRTGEAAGATSEDYAGSYDEQLQIALAMSEQDVTTKSREERDEDDELERILKLSLTEK